MPFRSQAQERWGHTPAGIEALGGPEKVKEWDNATRGRKLPARVIKVKKSKIITKIKKYL